MLFYTSGGPYVSLFYIKVVVACGGVNYFIYIIYIYITHMRPKDKTRKERDRKATCIASYEIAFTHVKDR